jgi:prevent-host-death family protein
MPPLRPSSDVLPVTEFRANTSAMLNQLHVTKRPVVLTQHGRSAAVLMDVGAHGVFGVIDSTGLEVRALPRVDGCATRPASAAPQLTASV